MSHVLIWMMSLMLGHDAWKLVPVSLSDLAHVRVLLWSANIEVGLVFYVTSVEAHDCKATDYKRTGPEDYEKDDKGWGNVEAHVVPLL